MKYRITITAVEPNPNYEKERALFEAQSRYNQFTDSPPAAAEREVKKLETVLTEAEFNAARAAILGAM